MSKTPAPLSLLLNIQAWKEQTTTLTPAERGAFVLLQMHYWRSGPIPDRDSAMAQITGMDLKDWKKARESLEPLFITGEGEWFRTDWNESLDAAYAAVKKASDAGKLANKMRWDRQKGRSKLSDSDSHSESVSNPLSILKKYTAKAPSQAMDVFVSTDSELELAVSAIEESFGGGK